MHLPAACGALFSALTLVAAAGCSPVCGATPERLAALQRGMSYQETSAIMKCDARSMTAPGAQGLARAEWNGRGPDLTMTVTEIEFLDGALLYYNTRSESGF
ncbi:MAG: hypothetical protein ISP45_30000 [Reyranella sp.]|nr:hypothetical protein [Reyranella sp.]